MSTNAAVVLDEAPAAPLEVAHLAPGDFQKWDAFVDSAHQGTFFHRAGWKVVLEQAFCHRTHFLHAQSGGVIEGVLPLAEIDSRVFGHSLVSLPFAVYGGIAAATERARHALDEAAQALARELGVDHLEYRNLRPQHPDWLKSELYVTFRKRIDADPETNMLAIPRKQRAMVRKGMKAGLESSIEDGVGRFSDLYADNMHRHGTPALPRMYFETLKDVFARDCEVLMVTRHGKPLSAVLSFYFRDEVLPYYAGDAMDARDCAANDFKYWELMRRAGERGCRVFDYGRSKRGTGSFDFKKNWGFEPAPLFYEYMLVRGKRMPENNPLNPRYRWMVAAWRRLPRGLANRIGPHIARSLG
jgi:FemAB-related protein (PEP-CTERM system-associated)